MSISLNLFDREESDQQIEESLNELDNWENTFEEISNRDYEIGKTQLYFSSYC